MYCSTVLPEPAAGATDALPSDLDDLVRKALKGGGRSTLGKLRERLSQPGPASAAKDTPARRGHVSRAAPPERASAAPAPAPAPAEPRRLPRALTKPAPPPEVVAKVEGARPRQTDPRTFFERLHTAAGEAHAAWAAGDAVNARWAVLRVRELLEDMDDSLFGIEVPDVDDLDTDMGLEAVRLPARPVQAVQLPLSSKPWMLVIEGPGDEARGEALAMALDVDRVTANQLAISRFPRVARRAEQPHALKAAARRIRDVAGLGAIVTNTRTLHQIPNPRVVVGGAGPGRLHVTDLLPDPTDDTPLVHTDTVPWQDVCVVVPGEVVMQRYRVGRGTTHANRGKVVVPSTERRVAVVDLHGPSSFLRVIQDRTDLSGLPGFTPNAGKRSVRAFADAVPWPGTRTFGSRILKPSRVPQLDDLSDQGTADVTGWADWEEHTRLCRLLAGLRVMDA